MYSSIVSNVDAQCIYMVEFVICRQQLFGLYLSIFQQMNLFHDLLTSNNMTLVTSVVVTDTTDYKSIISRLLVSLAFLLSDSSYT